MQDTTAAADRVIGGIPVLQRPAHPRDDPRGRYPGFRPGRSILAAGSVQRRGAMPLPCAITVDRDVAVALRDGTTIYVDVFRPADRTDPLPAILAWSPYGKGGGGNQVLDDIPGRAGVPRSAVSELQAWEAPDPAYWCAHGYAVVNADARGAYSSEGDIAQWGTQEGRDGADTVEWIAAQEWCTGRVGMAGNSWLAVAQWFVAAERPPHLAAIAPWEGMSDAYRDGMTGGIIETEHAERMRDLMCGGGAVEDMPAMAHRHPTMNPYWEDKAADLAAITVPAYVVASWTNPAHTTGTFAGFAGISSTEKWLRVHDTQEWHDFYSHSDDLRRFFDHVLRGVDNGWDRTPRVRLSVLDPSGSNHTERPESEFPLARTVERELFLDAATSRLVEHAPARAATSRPGADGRTVFTMRLEDDVEVVGHSSLRLWVEAPAGGDLDLFVTLEAARHGRVLASAIMPLPRPARAIAGLAHAAGVPATRRLFYTGPRGALRVSHRELDLARSTPGRPVLTHRSEERLTPGEIVEVEIALAPTGVRWHRGDDLRLTVSSRRGRSRVDAGEQVGDYVLHIGAERPARLLLPSVPR